MTTALFNTGTTLFHITTPLFYPTATLFDTTELPFHTTTTLLNIPPTLFHLMATMLQTKTALRQMATALHQRTMKLHQMPAALFNRTPILYQMTAALFHGTAETFHRVALPCPAIGPLFPRHTGLSHASAGPLDRDLPPCPGTAGRYEYFGLPWRGALRLHGGGPAMRHPCHPPGWSGDRAIQLFRAPTK